MVHVFTLTVVVGIYTLTPHQIVLSFVLVHLDENFKIIRIQTRCSMERRRPTDAVGCAPAEEAEREDRVVVRART